MANIDRLTTAQAHRYIIECRCGAGDLASTAEWRNGGTTEGSVNG